VAVGLVVLAAAPSALAADPDPLQDICVADLGKLQALRDCARSYLFKEYLERRNI
jgi:hypothetical protein